MNKSERIIMLITGALVLSSGIYYIHEDRGFLGIVGITMGYVSIKLSLTT